jgi:cell division protein FtsW
MKIRNHDWVLFFTIVVMVMFGLIIVTSASSVMAELKYKASWLFLLKQGGFAIVAFVVLMQLKRMDYRQFKSPEWAFGPLGIVLALLLIVYFADPRRHRWLAFGPISFQPSEFAKPALILFLAYFITWRQRAINDRKTLYSALLALSVLALVVVVADLGTAVVLVVTAATLFYIAGLENKYLLWAALAGVVLVFGAIASKPYRLARIVGFVDSDYSIVDKINPGGQFKAYVQSSMATRDPSYQARQSRIAIGAGGAVGVGLMQGRQKLLYLPEAHTDFIYAVVGEELGLWGATGILIGFFLILWRGLRLFWLAPDDFGKYLALGVTVSVVIQALINISVVLDIGPTKGIPLPMISYGGSSLVSTLASLGMLLSVSEQSG